MRLRAHIVGCLVWVCLFQVSSLLASRVRHYKWDVEYMYGSPDCIEGVVMGINGQFPGPTIRAQVGDTIAVALTNKLPTEGVVIHWHGILQKGTPWADGTASISQCAIKPDETFHYRFVVDKAGTYFYHGHYGMQRSAGLYGSLIVELEEGKREPFHYDGEFNLLLSDWWHKSSHHQELSLSSKPFRWIGEPQSLLINGRGQFNCSMAGRMINSNLPKCHFRGNEQCAPKFLDVLPRKTYGLRIASTTALASLNFAIQNHKMEVVEADGNYVQPFTVESLDIYSGESYSVLVTTDQDASRNYWIAIGVIGRKANTSQALTILNYKPTSASHLPRSPPPITPLWNDFRRSQSLAQKLMAQKGSPRPPSPSPYHRKLVLLNTQNLINGFTKWAINNVSLALPPTPYLGAIKFKLHHAFDPRSPPDNFPAEYDIMKRPMNPNTVTGNGVYMFKMNQVVDVILQNANVLNGSSSEVHPWHLHGHDFWVLGYGNGKFDAKKDEWRLNMRNPPLKNTAVIFPYGWTALRFVADNPGVWAFHCHIEPHLHMGMGVIFAEGVDQVKGIPTEALTCGLTGKMLLNMSNTIN